MKLLMSEWHVFVHDYLFVESHDFCAQPVFKRLHHTLTR